MLATGGALASAFVAIVAPLVFPGVWEYPILLVGALVALALVAPRVGRPSRIGPRARLQPVPRPGSAAGCAVPRDRRGSWSLGLVATGALATEAGVRWLLVGGLVLLVGARPWFLALSTAFVLALATFVLAAAGRSSEARSFFGVTEVLDSSRAISRCS